MAGELRAGLAWFDDDAQPVRVKLTPADHDKKLPALQRALGHGEFLVHRPGRRAVLRTTEGFVKVVRPHKVADAAERARAFHATGGPLITPRVLRSTDDGELAVTTVPGVSLHQLGQEVERDTWQSGWAAWADAWPDWVHTPGLGDHLPRYGVDDEEQTLAGWLLRVEMAQPAGLSLSSLRERFGSVMDALQATRRDVWRLSHRDLHDKQILVASVGAAPGSRAGLIDSDTLALADPALDLGNLLAHVRLREVQNLLSPARAEAAEQLIHDVAGQLSVPGAALIAWCDAASLRLSCVYAFRPVGSTS